MGIPRMSRKMITFLNDEKNNNNMNDEIRTTGDASIAKSTALNS
jgi:hypothetical protein